MELTHVWRNAPIILKTNSVALPDFNNTNFISTIICNNALVYKSLKRVTPLIKGSQYFSFFFFFFLFYFILFYFLRRSSEHIIILDLEYVLSTQTYLLPLCKCTKMDRSRSKWAKVDQTRPKYTKMDIIGLNWTKWIEVDRIGLK